MWPLLQLLSGFFHHYAGEAKGCFGRYISLQPGDMDEQLRTATTEMAADCHQTSLLQH